MIVHNFNHPGICRGCASELKHSPGVRVGHLKPEVHNAHWLPNGNYRFRGLLVSAMNSDRVLNSEGIELSSSQALLEWLGREHKRRLC